ncbi:hypothetical protein [Hymenobacter negativus]|uniref:Uncharacterized protein n=1 Tax=Hymenobacter negativus TaxID=2795026 RepID=A0ABS3QI10_9BACT|nr:hypothetical protein [Hymenobacter negativus]MBO2010879.1 hypothetical protein [Hymenobacter negativus]
MSDTTQPQPTEGGPVKMTLQAAVDQQTAKLAPQYVAEFQAMLSKVHPAWLVNPETEVVCEDKFEAAAYRVLLDAHDLTHIPVRIKAKPGTSLKKKILNQPQPPRRPR